MAEIVLITGFSGAGRSAAAAVLEDLGFYVVDNLPTSLLPTIVELASKPGGGIDRLALVSGRQHADVLPHVGAMRAAGHRVTIVYLDASTRELVRRYDATTAQASAGRRGRRVCSSRSSSSASVSADSATRPTS